MTSLPMELNARYDVRQQLGAGGQGTAFHAVDRTTGQEVVLKVLDFVDLTSWKDFDLWLREGKVLGSLQHPAVPRFLGHYPEAAGQGAAPEAIVSIQEYLPGRTLQDLLDEAEGPVLTESEARTFLDEMLGVLEYLHGLNPPVVHRDIKPSNIVRRPDGSHALIDFGAARSASILTGSTTFVGTNGYMPPEQLMGRAEPRSDLHALGATVVHLLSGLHPSDLVGADYKIDLSHVPVSEEFRRYLGRLTHPMPERRYATAQRAREALGAADGALVLAAEQVDGLRVVRTDDGATALRFPRPKIGLVLMNVFVLMLIALGIGFNLTRDEVALAPLVAQLVIGAWFAVLLAAPLLRAVGRVELHPDRVSFRSVLVRRSLPLDKVVSVRTKTDTYKHHLSVFIETADGDEHVMSGPMGEDQAGALLRAIEAHVEEHR